VLDTVKIVYRRSDYQKSCFLTSKQAKYYGLNSNKDYVTLMLGSLKINLNKVIVDNDIVAVNELCLSEDLKDCMHIPKDTKLQIKRGIYERLIIGPYIGIFINTVNMPYMEKGHRFDVYEQYNDACESMYGFCCFFSINDIDWKNKLVNSFVWSNSEWVNCTLPLPKVIYDRNVEVNCRRESIKLRKKLDSRYQVINSMPKIGKLETVEALSTNSELIGIVPKTVPYYSNADISDALQKYKRIYLKPDILGKGKGIFRIGKKTNGNYVIEYRTKTRNHVLNSPDLNVLDDLMSDYSAMGGGYLIQEEIDKALYKGNPFDFRLLYQKDWKGTWQPSGIAVRMGAPGSIITSPRSGGEVEELSTVLKEEFGEDTTTKGGLYENIIKYGREICLTIDKELGDCVELGLDMTIDTSRKIWVIEVNGKPLKVSLSWLEDDALTLRCNKRPIEYAVYLTGFQSADTETGGLYNKK
jgi:hypothetical protein